MSLFPNILHPSTYCTLLADQPKIAPSTPSQTDHKPEHQTTHQVDHHHIAAFFISFLSHMFAPAAYQQCTSSTPCWAPSHHAELLSKSSSSSKAVIIVDDEFVLLEDSESETQDGGPLCREATIESWKAPKKNPWTERRWSDLPYFGSP
jgi:hypothetical protein